MVTGKQVQAIAAVANAIRELGTVPSGHLYARLMNYMDAETYGMLIATLVRAGLIEDKNHLLTWIGGSL